MKNENYEHPFAAKLREIMEMKNVSQTQLSEKTGITRQVLNSYCLGKTFPNIEGLIAIAKTLEVTTDYLLDMPSIKINVPAVCDYIGISIEALNTLRTFTQTKQINKLTANFLLSNDNILNLLNNYMSAALETAINNSKYVCIPLKTELQDISKFEFASIIENLPLLKANFAKSENWSDEVLLEFIEKNCNMESFLNLCTMFNINEKESISQALDYTDSFEVIHESTDPLLEQMYSEHIATEETKEVYKEFLNYINNERNN